MGAVLENGLAALQVDLKGVQVELFASKVMHMMQLYCSRYVNTAYRFYWRSMELCYANPPFSQLAKVLTQIALDNGRVVVCIPGWDTTGEHAYWAHFFESITFERTELPNGPIYITGDSQGTMLAPEWQRFLSIIDGTLSPVPVCDLDQEVLKESMTENRGLTLPDCKKTCEYSSVTTGRGECLDEQKTPAVPTPVADANGHLSEIAISIPRAELEVMTLKRSAFLGQLLMEEVNRGDSTPCGCHDHAIFSMRAAYSPTGQVPGAKPSPKNMPITWYDMRAFNRSYGLRLRVSSNRPAWTSSGGTGKRLYGPRRMMKK